MSSWYSYDPERGYETFGSPEEAERDAGECLEHHRDKSADGWNEDVSSIEWGLLVPYGEAQMCDKKDAEEGSDFDYLCDYRLTAVKDRRPLEEAHRDEMRERVALWEAINRYVVACHGDPSKHVYGNTARMNAVVEIERIVKSVRKP